MKSSVSIRYTKNGKQSRLPFLRLKDAILGCDYDLSVAFVTKNESRALNKQYRGKDNSTNVLSFPLSETSGELILDPETARTQAVDFDMTQQKYLLFLVIHGMLHLKGYDHGSTMEKEEKKFLKLFSK